MAHSPAFLNQDKLLTSLFLTLYRQLIKGEMMIDFCGGSSRCGEDYCKAFNKVSVLDLKPSWGKIPLRKQGTLIKANFKDIGYHIEPDQYDFMLLNWSFCYINYDVIKRVLSYLYSSLKSDGHMVIKEPVLEMNEHVSRLCPSGQYLITRPKKELMRMLSKYFYLVDGKIIRQEKDCDRQILCLMKKKPLNQNLWQPYIDKGVKQTFLNHWYCFKKKAHINCQHRRCKRQNEKCLKTLSLTK